MALPALNADQNLVVCRPSGTGMKDSFEEARSAFFGSGNPESSAPSVPVHDSDALRPSVYDLRAALKKPEIHRIAAKENIVPMPQIAVRQ
jgi:hypothetical protein